MKKRLKVAILALSLQLCLGLIGCASIRLYPIDQQDIVIMRKGESYTPDRDGYFLSNLYMQEVMDAKTERIKLK